MIDSNQRLLKLHYSHLIKFRSLNLLVSLRKVIKIHKTMVSQGHIYRRQKEAEGRPLRPEERILYNARDAIHQT